MYSWSQRSTGGGGFTPEDWRSSQSKQTKKKSPDTRLQAT